MSWFDTSGLTNLAKSALKEAQKTIDKALDIQQEIEDGEVVSQTETEKPQTQTTVAVEGGDFFSSWGLTPEVPESNNKATVITQSPSKNASQTLWGSFTGSFFENASKAETEKEKSNTLGIISDDPSEIADGDSFSKSKLVVHGVSEECEGGGMYSRTEKDKDLTTVTEDDERLEDDKTDADKTLTDDSFIVHRKNSDKRNISHRLSLVSSESCKNSSESIEIINSQSAKTTPDSDITSFPSTSVESNMALNLNPSCSVEIIPDSLMTPSSIELLGFNSGDLSTASEEEFHSPVSSPMENITITKHGGSELKTFTVSNLISCDEEEVSAADDTMSYNSISEFTVPTILDSSNKAKGLESALPKKHGSLDALVGSSLDSFTVQEEETPITRAPSKSSLHLLSSSSNSQKSLKDSSSTSQSDSNLKVHSSIQPIPPTGNDNYTSSAESSWSDRTLNADINSSIDDLMIKSNNFGSEKSYDILPKSNIDEDKMSDQTSDSLSFVKLTDSCNSTWKETGSNQSYEEIDKGSSIDQLENIAMLNSEYRSREQHSPVSSDSRSGDMIKIGSEQTSGHTSGDDLETNTSSDIEIIPSPNGDYGSIYNMDQSPGKIPLKFAKHIGSAHIVDFMLSKTLVNKIRGHNRELSEASSQSNTSDDSHCSETERLMKRLAEISEVLENREAKLVEISRKNIELHECNNELKSQLETLQGKQDVADVNLITEEYTQRLSALEKKFQQAIREKDIVRKQLETLKKETSTRMTSSELETALKERDEIIKELREEGEKLSKQQLNHTTIIKRLRTKEKENEQVIKTLRDKVADQSQETDRLKRLISAKEAIECSQIEAVYKLTTANKKLETELADAKGNLDDSNQKVETMKTSLESARKELVELQKNSGDLVKRKEELNLLESERTSLESENEQLLHQLEELRNKLRQDEQRWKHRETSLRQEVSLLLARVEEAEANLQNCQMMGGTTDGQVNSLSFNDSSSLLAQLTALQETSLERDRRAQAREARLQQNIAEQQAKVTKLNELNQMLKDECQGFRSKIANNESIIASLNQKIESSASSSKEYMDQLNVSLETNDRLKQEYTSLKDQYKHETHEFSEKLKELEGSFKMEKAAHEAEKRRNVILQEQLRDISNDSHNIPGSSLLLARLVGDGVVMNNTNVISQNNSINIHEKPEPPSPSGSTGRDSQASESIGSGIWPIDDNESIGINSSVLGTGLIGDGIYTLERLQAALQRREGELKAAWRATKRCQAQKQALQNELALSNAELDTMQALQHQYDALLQMYGEKEEQLQELRLDLQDVKDMYKMQLDEILMLKRQAAEKSN